MTDELELIKEIRKTGNLPENTEVTPLMQIALLTYNKNGLDSLEKAGINISKAAAKYAVEKDYHNIEKVPAESRKLCAPEYLGWTLRVSKNNAVDFSRVSSSIVKADPELGKRLANSRDFRKFCYIKREDRPARPQNAPKKLPKRTSAGSGLIHPTELDASFSELTPGRIDYEMNAEAFIHAPVKEQEFEWLQALLDTDILFPPYFLKSLVRPLVNIEFYKKNGDKENEEYWEKQKLPYINKKVCQVIANSHPEAAIETPSFITKRAVNEFWTKHVEDLDAKTLTTYFLAFPESVLSSYMADDIFVTEKVLCHAPNIMKDTTAAWQFISRNPKYIFSLPWQYQREGLLVGGSINIADLKANVDKIINTELREKIALAFDIPFTADEIEENTENDI